MFGLGEKRIIDRDIEDWHWATWEYLIEKLGPPTDTPLVLPTAEFFPPGPKRGHELASHIFSCVKESMGMSEFPVELRPQPSRPGSARVDEFLFLVNEGVPLGTFSIENGQAIITYEPSLTSSPKQLIATFAHELSHYLLAPHHNELGEDMELVTDLCVAYAGFGVFGANASPSLTQHGDAFGQGWRVSGGGYMSPSSWGFAMAVFMALVENQSDLSSWLRKDILGYYKKSRAHLAKNPGRLAALKRV